MDRPNGKDPMTHSALARTASPTTTYLRLIRGGRDSTNPSEDRSAEARPAPPVLVLLPNLRSVVRFDGACQALSADDWQRLRAFAGKQGGILEDMGHGEVVGGDDLLSDAILRTRDGRAEWPEGRNLESQLRRLVFFGRKTTARRTRQRKRLVDRVPRDRGPEETTSSTSQPGTAKLATSAPSVESWRTVPTSAYWIVPSPYASAEELFQSRSSQARLDDMLPPGTIERQVADLLLEGYKRREIIEKLGLTTQRYDTTFKKIQAFGKKLGGKSTRRARGRERDGRHGSIG